VTTARTDGGRPCGTGIRHACERLGQRSSELHLPLGFLPGGRRESWVPRERGRPRGDGGGGREGRGASRWWRARAPSFPRGPRVEVTRTTPGPAVLRLPQDSPLCNCTGGAAGESPARSIRSAPHGEPGRWGRWHQLRDRRDRGGGSAPSCAGCGSTRT
jgi:hypothetical protein